MNTNTPNQGASNATRSSLGEQWMPVPTRLVDALVEAPSARRRAWAVAYLLVWLLTFRRKSKGAPATLGEIEAWSQTNSRQRTVKARKDALGSVEKWTDRGLEVDCKWTGGKQVETGESEPSGLQVDRKRTAHAGADLHPTDLQDYTTPSSPPAGDAVEKPVDAVDKPKRKRSTSKALTLEQIAAVEIPAVLKSLPGWSEAWAMFSAHRQELPSSKRWKMTSQVTRFLAGMAREHGKGNTGVVDALYKSAESGWSGAFPKPLQGAANTPQGTGSGPMAPEAIWQAMMACMARVGGRRLPTVLDAPELDEVTFKRAMVALGGPARWTAVCSTRPNDLHFRVRPAFVRSFRSEVA